MRKRTVFILALLCTAFWGAGYPVVKLSYQYFEIDAGDVPTKLLFAGIRFLCAGLLTMAVALFTRKKSVLPQKSHWGGVLLLAVFQTTLQYAFTYLGLAGTTGAKSSVLNQLNVFLLVLLTPLFFRKEHITAAKVLGCVVGFGGILVMNLNGLSLSFNLGDGFILLASVSAAVGYLISKALVRDENPFSITAFQQLIGGAILFVIGAASGGQLHTITTGGILCLLFLIVAASAAYSIWVVLLRSNEVSSVSVYKFLTPVFGVLMSGAMLGESVFSVQNLAALALVSIGILIVFAGARILQFLRTAINTHIKAE